MNQKNIKDTSIPINKPYSMSYPAGSSSYYQLHLKGKRQLELGSLLNTWTDSFTAKSISACVFERGSTPQCGANTTYANH